MRGDRVIYNTIIVHKQNLGTIDMLTRTYIYIYFTSSLCGANFQNVKLGGGGCEKTKQKMSTTG